MDVILDRPLDLEDLDATPDDGNRYEILDNAIVMTPPPNPGHQTVVTRLLVLLHPLTGAAGLEVMPAPVGWRVGPGQVPEPDLIVAPTGSITHRAVEGPPVLVVEVLSPSGRGRDLYEKRRIYAAGRAAWYWIVDPDEPSLTVLRLAGQGYEEVARVTGSEPYAASEPVQVRVVAADLVR